MPLPQTRTVTDAAGFRWYITVDRGRLVLTCADDDAQFILDDPTDLRWLGMQTHRAAVEYDLDVQHAAAKRSADRRVRRLQAGQPAGNRHRPVVESAEPAMNLDPAVRALEASA